MDSKDSTFLLIVSFLVIAVLLIVSRKDKQEIKELRQHIDNDKRLTEDVRRRLIGLVEDNQDIDPAVAQEIMSISALVEIKQDTKALFGLAKVIERLLKELYSDDPEFLSRKDHSSFASYLDHATAKGVVSKEDFHLISLLRLIRNEEAHELNVKKEQSKIMAAFVAGTALVIVLSRLVHKKLASRSTVA